MLPTLMVIHDHKRTDRYNLLIKELQSQNINPDEVIWMPSVRDPLGPITGISKAHRNCVQKAKDLGLDHVTILEDDIMFTSPHSFRRYMDIFSDLPEDWDIYFAGLYSMMGRKQHSATLVTARDIAGLQCYTVRNKFFDTFLTAPDNYHIDRWLLPKGHAKAYITWPFLAMQHDGHSDQKNRHLTLSSYHRSFVLWKPEAYKR
jgi:GR25 family glycosyltransferase involved in LPS biosynthesis